MGTFISPVAPSEWRLHGSLRPLDRVGIARRTDRASMHRPATHSAPRPRAPAEQVYGRTPPYGLLVTADAGAGHGSTLRT
jgi:hypothetical protein